MTFIEPFETEKDSQIEWRQKLVRYISKTNAGEDITLKEFLSLCNDISKGKFGITDEHQEFANHIAHLHSEVSEMYEEFRKGRGFNETYFKNEKPEGIPVEAADVLLKLFAICGAYEIDILSALPLKVVYNAAKRKKKSEVDYG